MPRLPALDGLRGVAVLLVFVYHVGITGWPGLSLPLTDGRLLIGGGFVGVQLFFALSGYLITSILLAELERAEQLNLGRFYLRRVRRLYPALLAVCVALVVISLATGELAPATALSEAARALTYTSNVWELPVWLKHTWSLSVEEQFYVVWPLLAWGVFRLGGRKLVGWFALALAGGVMVCRHTQDLSLHANYFVLRWDAPLAGCAVAAFGFAPRRALVWAVPVLVAHSLTMPMVYDAWPYTLTAIASAVVVAGATNFRALESSVLRHFGTISYGLYCWHGLLMHLALPWWAWAWLSLLVAEMSWRYVESPFISRARPGEADPSASPAPGSPPPSRELSSVGSSRAPAASS